jgi:hypothetical protein
MSEVKLVERPKYQRLLLLPSYMRKLHRAGVPWADAFKSGWIFVNLNIGKRGWF